MGEHTYPSSKCKEPHPWDASVLETIVICPFCKVQHVDQGSYAKKNHTLHLCLKGDGGCGRFFFTKEANVGVRGPPSLEQTAKAIAKCPKCHPVKVRCKARDLDDAESYRCELEEGHGGPHFNEWAEPDTADNPWERGLDAQRFLVKP